MSGRSMSALRAEKLASLQHEPVTPSALSAEPIASLKMSVNLSSQSHPNSPILAPVGDVRSPIEQKVAQLSEQLASIKLTNANKEAEVGNVAAELDKIKKIFKGLSNDVKDISSMKNMYTEVVSLRNYCRDEVVRIHQEVAGLNQMIQGFHISLEGLSAQVLEIARLGSGVQRDVPEMSILFSGNPRETRRFVFQARTVLHEKSDCFCSEKSKINWIKRVCQRCGGSFNDEHKANKGCPLPSEKHIDVQRKVELFRNWLAQGGQDVVYALARAAEDERVAKTSRGSNPSGGTAEVPLDAIPPLSLGELCWQQAASEILPTTWKLIEIFVSQMNPFFYPSPPPPHRPHTSPTT
ncbi:hypothetical protein H4Q26_010799 [Puccinia striiformis f. sp. tritici PST-130]|nr:hypothetical protein H4Q26_010799 [Puccinia striiformis f. sp. tritici PST-130]